MGTPLVVEGCTLLDSVGTAVVNPVTSVLSETLKCSGKKVYLIVGFNKIVGSVSTAGLINGNSMKIKSGMAHLPVVLSNAVSGTTSIALTGQTPLLPKVNGI